MLVLEDLVVFIKLFNFSFFSITGWGIDLDYRDIEWFALEMNRDHSVVSEIASKNCILDSFVYLYQVHLVPSLFHSKTPQNIVLFPSPHLSPTLPDPNNHEIHK